MEQSEQHIQRLPDELLYDIFKKCRTISPLAPLAISQCCRRWRTLALNYPVLWNQIRVDLIRSVELLTAWIDRSQQLSLEIELQPTIGSKLHEFLERSLDILELQAIRWERLCIELRPHPKMTSSLTSRLLSRRHLPKLVSLRVQTFGPTIDSTDIIQAGVEHMPSLQELSIQGPNGALLKMSKPDWWSCPLLQPGLKRLSLIAHPCKDPPTLDACLSLLQQCPCLESLDLLLPLKQPELASTSENPESQESQEGQEESTILTLPQLTRLNLGVKLSLSGLRILASIRTPNLTRFDTRIPYDLISDFGSLYPLPFPKLKNLVVAGSTAYPNAPGANLQGLEEVLVQLPELASFTILDTRLYNQQDKPHPILDALGIFCPRLESLNFYGCEGDAGTVGALRLLVQTRRESFGLQRISTLIILDSLIKFQPEDVQWFAASMEKGFSWNAGKSRGFQPGT